MAENICIKIFIFGHDYVYNYFKNICHALRSFSKYYWYQFKNIFSYKRVLSTNYVKIKLP